MEQENAPWAQKLLSFWFGPLTNGTKLDRSMEPFQTQMGRWYGKDPAVDRLIRELFEPTLLSVTGSAANWNRAERAAAGDVRAQLALTVLIDQLPRNMYRDTPRMYEHDALALAHAYRSLPDAMSGDLSLVERMFAIVPLMHAEDLTIQLVMEECFVELLRDAEQVSPHNLDFFQFALDYARRHREIIQRFGRFPHRNLILNRRSTPEEDTALRTESLAF